MAQGYYYDSVTSTWIAIGVGPQGPQGQMGAQGNQGPQGSPASVVYDSGTQGPNNSTSAIAIGTAIVPTLTNSGAAGMYLLSGSCWETSVSSGGTIGTVVVPAIGFFSAPAGTKSQTLYGSTATGNVLGTQTSFAAVLYHDGVTANSFGFQSTGYSGGTATTKMQFSYRVTIQYMKA